MQLHHLHPSPLTPHPSSLTVNSKGIFPANDITCSYDMAMLCVQSVLQATNAHYVHIEDKQMKPSLATIMCMMDKTTSGFLP